jgi:hypothetical protein
MLFEASPMSPVGDHQFDHLIPGEAITVTDHLADTMLLSELLDPSLGHIHALSGFASGVMYRLHSLLPFWSALTPSPSLLLEILA